MKVVLGIVDDNEGATRWDTKSRRFLEEIIKFIIARFVVR